MEFNAESEYDKMYRVNGKANMKRLFKIFKILTEECDPERFISEHDKIIASSEQANLNVFHLSARFNAFSAMGSHDQAKSMLDLINCESELNYVKALYYINLACFYLNTDNFEEAKKCYSYLTALELDEIWTLITEPIIKAVVAGIKFQEGNLKESREIFNGLLRTQQIMSSKAFYLNCIFDLALIDIAEQKADDARIGLEKVIQEGNKLHIVTLAKQELEKLDSV